MQPYRILVATPYGEDGMGGIDRLNDLIFDGVAQSELGVRCQRLVTRGKRGLAIAQPVFASALVRFGYKAIRGHVDLLHIHLSGHGSSYRKAVLARAAHFLGVPYVVHLHGTDYREFWEGANKVLRSAIDKMFSDSARVIVLGAFWADVVRDRLPSTEHKIVVLPNATPFAPASMKDVGRGGPARITFLGQLGARKGTSDLVAALEHLAHRDGWTATIAGDGAIAETRTQVRAAGLESRVDVPGWLGIAERTRLLEHTDLLVLPSYAENLPMVLLEAFAHGIPVISTPVGAIPEVLVPERNGLLVPPGDVEALAEAIGRLVDDDDLRRQMGKLAGKDHLERFEIGRYVARLVGLWREVIQEQEKDPSRNAGLGPGAAAAVRGPEKFTEDRKT